MTIGHSTRAIDEFIDLLRAHGVVCVADVRSVPRSRRNPQFGQERLPDALRAAGLRYIHFPALGGLRKPVPDSINAAWRNLSFRGYADHMLTPAFGEGLRALIDLSRQARTAAMCAEALPWRCHRCLVCDALIAHGIIAEHILSPTKRQAHVLTEFAVVQGTDVTYPNRDARNAVGQLPMF